MPPIAACRTAAGRTPVRPERPRTTPPPPATGPRRVSPPRSLLAVAALLGLAACGGGDDLHPPQAQEGRAGALSVRAAPVPLTPSDTSVTATAQAAASTLPKRVNPGARPPRVPAPPPVPAIDAVTLTDPTAPLMFDVGDRTFSPPVTINGKHNPANYRPAPVLPHWQFATTDPTNGVLTFEREVAPAHGWHSFSRRGPVVVSGGASAAPDRVYTVFNREQLLAALREARNEPKIIRVVGHIDFRWSEGNTVFREYTSFTDQNRGGSFSIPSNTTLVGINGPDGRPARITGTQILIGREMALAPGGSPEADFKAWVAQGRDPELYPTWTRNIIIRNLAIDPPWDVNPEDSGNAFMDGIAVTRGQQIWIDHVTISDGDTPGSLASDTRHDGALDIIRGTDYVTVSNSRFTRHAKVTLVGNGDSGRAWSDAGRLRVTFHGNWWDHVESRMPLARFGLVHLYNNLVSGTTYSEPDRKFARALDVRFRSDVLSEGNFYEFTGLKPREVCGKLVDGRPSEALSFRSRGHRFISDKDDDGRPMTAVIDVELQGCKGLPVQQNWVPPYGYVLRHADAVRGAVKSLAGAGRLGLFGVTGPVPDFPPGTPASPPEPAPPPPPPGPPPPPPPPPPPVDPGEGPGCTAVLPCGNGSGEVVPNAGLAVPVPEAVFDAETGSYTLHGVGSMSNANSWNFNFKYTPLVGDFSFTARITVQGGSTASARAGVLAATTLEIGSVYAWTARYAGTGEIRAATDGNGRSALPGFGSSTPPVWVRIERRGNALFSMASNDGVTWSERTNLSVSQPTLFVGLALSSGSNTSTVQAVFDQVSLVGGR